MMGSFSLMHWLIVLAIVLLLFGAGKLPRVMGDFAKGIKAFKAGMREDEEIEEPKQQQVSSQGPASSSSPASSAEHSPSARPGDHA